MFDALNKQIQVNWNNEEVTFLAPENETKNSMKNTFGVMKPGCWLSMALLEVLFLGGMLGGVAEQPSKIRGANADKWWEIMESVVAQPDSLEC